MHGAMWKTLGSSADMTAQQRQAECDQGEQLFEEIPV